MRIFHILAVLCVFSCSFAEASSEVQDQEPTPRFLDVSRTSVRIGPQFGFGACPCFRWRVGLVGRGGEWLSTKEILVSTEAVVNAQLSFQPFLGNPILGEAVVNAGGVDVYLKSLQTGIGFRGVDIGHQRDIGYAFILRTGMYLFAQLWRTQNIGVRLFSGVDYDHARVNDSVDVSRILFPQTLEMRWSSDTGVFKGLIRGGGAISTQASAGSQPQKKLFASGAAQLRIFNVREFEGLMGVFGEYEYDSMREAFGLEPHRGVTGLFMEIDYVPRSVSKAY